MKDKNGSSEKESILFPKTSLFGSKTLVFDECHHLISHWADIILAFLKTHPDSFIIGLTATPPVHRSHTEQAKFLKIVGNVDAEVQNRSSPALSAKSCRTCTLFHVKPIH